MSLKKNGDRHNVLEMFRYTARMDQMLEIPQNRKRLNVSKLCLLLGMTTLLYMMVAHEFAGALVAPLP